MKFLFSKKKQKAKQKGFTLIEAIVSIFLFIIVMVVAAGALLSIISANKKSEAVKSVMDSLNFTLENMARNVRVGSSYSCGDGRTVCVATGSSSFQFTTQTGQTILYQYGSSGGGQLVMTILSDANNPANPLIRVPQNVLPYPEINLTKAVFYVDGDPTDQSRVLIALAGTVGEGKTLTSFAVSTSITKR
jgi:type II secretory pathway pseudopilin PulG